MAQFRTIVIYALVLALVAFALEWAEYQYLTRAFAAEIYIVLIALGFTALGIWLGARLTQKPHQAFAKNEQALRTLGVTPREYAVLELIAEGRSNKEIARSLGVSPNTVKTHISRLFTKLDAQRRIQAIERARSLRLIP